MNIDLAAVYTIGAMADDGMLVNFELPADSFAPRQKFKGGTWRDRQRAANKQSIPRFEVHSDDEELILSENQPRKRTKIHHAGPSKLLNGLTPQKSFDKLQTSLPTSSNKDVISSLFTYNPKSTASQGGSVLENENQIEPSNAPLADDLATFTNLGLSSALANHLLKKLEVKAPTAIQRKAIEQLCSADTDAFIQAETGSGKTLAYLLPILQRITNLSKQMKENGQDFQRESGLFAIIIAPTRELSKQISSVLENLLSCCHWIVGGTVIGGEKKKSEKARLRKGLNVLVATPGRLADHLDNTEVLDVSLVRWLVLDEGDRLMELGFEKDIQKIVSVLNLRGSRKKEGSIFNLPDRRMTVLCSATLKSNVDQLKSIALKDTVSISIDASEQQESEDAPGNVHAFSAPTQLKQSYVVVPPKQRLVTLVAVLKQAFKRKGSVLKCIVFMSCADSVDFHFELLTNVGTASNARAEKDETKEESTTTSLPSLSRSDRIPQGDTMSEMRTRGPAVSLFNEQNQVQLFRLHGSLPQATRTSTLKEFTKSTDPAVLVCTDVASRGLDLPNIDLVIEYDPPFNKDDHIHRIGRTARAGKDGRATIFLMPGCEEGYVSILKDGRPHHLTRHDADELLKKGFSPGTGVVAGNDWEDRATDWQLDVERWVLEHPKHLEQARRAFQSHIRAYATHVAAERSMFDMQQLHLGHLAKAFALRDKPGSIRVPGMRPGKDANTRSKEARKAKAGQEATPSSQHRQSRNYIDMPAMRDEQDARRKMQAKMKALRGALEFNLG